MIQYHVKIGRTDYEPDEGWLLFMLPESATRLEILRAARDRLVAYVKWREQSGQEDVK